MSKRQVKLHLMREGLRPLMYVAHNGSLYECSMDVMDDDAIKYTTVPVLVGNKVTGMTQRYNTFKRIHEMHEAAPFGQFKGFVGPTMETGEIWTSFNHFADHFSVTMVDNDGVKQQVKGIKHLDAALVLGWTHEVLEKADVE